MATIDIKLKSYDELLFEITTLNTNKYLLEQKLNKYKEVLDKIKKLELYEFDLDYDYEENPVEHYTPFFMREYIEKLLEEIE